jgi:hypothetical protein
LDENAELAQKHASLTWGDCSFTVMATNTIGELTEDNGFLDAGGNLKDAGKDLILKRMHSKFLEYHLLELLSESARQAIEQNSSIYTWSNVEGDEEEVDGLMVFALILGRIRPNFKVDMYAEIGQVKKLTIAQYDNDVQLFFDAIKFLKLQINQKDPTAYTEDAFIRDIFIQLKHESLPSDFRHEFACQENHWMMNKAHITSQTLIDDASAYYVNLKNTGAWRIELSGNTQIIALTTQLSELKTEMTKLSAAKIPLKQNENTPPPGGKYVFEFWRLKKIDNKAEHSMVERDGKTWYWCNQHTFNNKGVRTNGMYVNHKPEDHGVWLERRRKGKKSFAPTPTDGISKQTTKPTSSVSNDSSASKLSLSKSLQVALVATAGISEDQFKMIWADACNALGN